MRELDGSGQVGLRLREFAETRDHRSDFSALARQRAVALEVARRVFGSEQRVDLREATAQLVELGAQRKLHPSGGDSDSP